MRYKLLGKSGLRVSELGLGTMTFGQDWGWGASWEESRKIFEAFANAGGNFVDTAINYTNGTSEQYVGDFIANDREHFVVATKYTLNTRRDDPNAGGNQRKNMVQSVEKSLKRLKTDYIDLYWLHVWDFTTPIEEILRGFDDLVRAGKVLYVGISDSPAWVIAQMVTMAELRGWSRPVAIQLPYNLAGRSPERELLPMARALDLAVTCWGLIGGGVLTGKYNQASTEAKRYGDSPISQRTQAIVTEIGNVAEESGRSKAQIAINWVRQQQQKAQIIPILGARTAQQMHDNLACLEFELTPAQLQRLTNAAKIELGFPSDFLVDDEVQDLIFGNLVGKIENHRR